MRTYVHTYVHTCTPNVTKRTITMQFESINSFHNLAYTHACLHTYILFYVRTNMARQPSQTEMLYHTVHLYVKKDSHGKCHAHPEGGPYQREENPEIVDLEIRWIVQIFLRKARNKGKIMFTRLLLYTRTKMCAKQDKT